MKLTKTFPLEEKKITRKMVAGLGAGESITAYCDDIKEINSVRVNIFLLNKKLEGCGMRYEVSQSYTNKTVSVTAVPTDGHE